MYLASNLGVRENAEIEVVVDVQLAALEGVRFLTTASGCLQTPDWVSNRYITFIYNRRSNEPVWHNRVYGLYRQRLSSAINSTSEAFPIMAQRDLDYMSRHGSYHPHFGADLSLDGRCSSRKNFLALS